MIEISRPIKALSWLTGAVLLLLAAAQCLPLADGFLSCLGAGLAVLALVPLWMAIAHLVGSRDDAAHDAHAGARTVVLLLGEEAAREHTRDALGLEIVPNFDNEGAVAYVKEVGGRVFLEKAPQARGHTSRLLKYVDGAMCDPHMVACVHRLATLIDTDRAAVGEERPWVTTVKDLQLSPSTKQNVHVALVLSLRDTALGSLLAERALDLGADPERAIGALQRAVWRGLTHWLERNPDKTPQEQQRCVQLAAEAHRELTTLGKHLSRSNFPLPWTRNRALLLNDAAGDREVFSAAVPDAMRSPVQEQKFLGWVAQRFVAAPPAPARIPAPRVAWAAALVVITVGVAVRAEVKPRSDRFWTALTKASSLPPGATPISAVCDAYAGPGVLRLVHEDELEGLARQDACALPSTTDDAGITRFLQNHAVSEPGSCLRLIQRTIARCNKVEPGSTSTPTSGPTPTSPGTTIAADCTLLTNLLADELGALDKRRQLYPLDSTSARYLPVGDWPSQRADDELLKGISRAPKACQDQREVDIRRVTNAAKWRKKARTVVSADDKGNLIMHALVRMRVDGGSCPATSAECAPSLNVAGETLRPIGFVSPGTVRRGSFCWAPAGTEGHALYQLKLGTHRHVTIDVPTSPGAASSHAQVMSKYDATPGSGPWSFLDLTDAYTQASFPPPLPASSDASLRFGSVALSLGSGLGTLTMEVIPVAVRDDQHCASAAPGGRAAALPELEGWLDFLQYVATAGEGVGDGGPGPSTKELRYQVLPCGGRNAKPCTSGRRCFGSLVECNGVCVDTESDVNSCGQCSACKCDGSRGCTPERLGAFRMCKAGRCLPCGGRGEEACPGEGCRDGLNLCGSAGLCVSVADDPANCGECGHVCEKEPNTDPTHACAAAHCQCARNHDRCGGGGACVPLTTKEHCGTCQACTGKRPECVASGDGGFRCADIWTDPDHCGSVGHKCASAQDLHEQPLCADGTCKCARNHDRCDGGIACMPLTTKEHCGTCQPCAGKQPECVPSGDGESRCADLATDRDNCGSIGRKCAPELHEQSLCVGGKCKCLDGWVDIDAGKGCEQAPDAGAPKGE